MRAGTHRAGDFSDGQLLRGHLKTREIAAVFSVPVGDLQPEGNRLSVDSVRATDFRRVFKLPGAPLQNFTERFDFFLDEMGSFADK